MRWHVGELSLGQAIHAGTIALEGPRWLQRLLASWGGQVRYPEPAPVAQTNGAHAAPTTAAAGARRRASR